MSSHPSTSLNSQGGFPLLPPRYSPPYVHRQATPLNTIGTNGANSPNVANSPFTAPFLQYDPQETFRANRSASIASTSWLQWSETPIRSFSTRDERYTSATPSQIVPFKHPSQIDCSATAFSRDYSLAPSSGAESVTSSSKAYTKWTEEDDTAIVDALLVILRRGEAPDVGWKRPQYEEVAKKLNERDPTAPSKTWNVVQSRYQTLKSTRYNPMAFLMNKSGAGWNPITYEVKLSDAVWREVGETVGPLAEAAYKMRGKPWPLYKDFAILNTGRTADGTTINRPRPKRLRNLPEDDDGSVGEIDDVFQDSGQSSSQGTSPGFPPRTPKRKKARDYNEPLQALTQSINDLLASTPATIAKSLLDKVAESSKRLDLSREHHYLVIHNIMRNPQSASYVSAFDDDFLDLHVQHTLAEELRRVVMT